jgi:hypothetical protein
VSAPVSSGTRERRLEAITRARTPSRAQMLPSLAHLDMREIDTTKKRKREEEDIYFKAYKNGLFQKLSNLFGPVEWKFQAAKFKTESGVREWLLKNATKEWTREEFDEARLAMKHGGKLESYVASDGEIASGLLAKMCSLIASKPKSVHARKRLEYILGRSFDSKKAEEWAAANVNEELGDAQKKELLKNLLREKFEIPKYRELLLETGDRELHEAKGQGAPNWYEYHPLTEAQELENEHLISMDKPPKWQAGGDVMGTC